MTSKFKDEVTLPLLNSYGRARLTLLGTLVCSLLVFGFLLLLQNPAQAFVTKGTSCSAASCHGATQATATLSVALNGTQGTAITVSAGSTFEVDWMFTNLLFDPAKYDGTNPELAVPTGWTVAVGTANTPGLTGWSSTWDTTGGSSWNTTYSTATEFSTSPVGYAVDFNGTSWDTGNRNAAFDNGAAGDLDGVANKMGSDARITVPAGTAAGTYTVMVLGIGHNSANTKAHIEQAVTVNVRPVVTSTSPNSMPQGTGPTTVTINGSSFTSTGLSVSFSGTGVSAGTATYVSATQITVPVTVTAGASIGARDVSVTCSGQSGTGTGVFSVTGGLTATTTTVTNPAAITYGQTTSFTATVNPAAATGTVQFKVDGANVGSPVTVNSGSATISGVTGLAAGSRSVTAVYSGDSTYATSTSSAVTQTVIEKTLTITADAKSKIYGAADPALTYTSSGLVGGDTISGNLTRAAGENVGNYAINQGSLSAGSNYTISYTGANLTVNSKPVTVTAAAKSKVYGAADPALTYTVDTGDTLSGSLTRVAGENAGSYAIQQGTVTNATNPNYSITYVGADLTINAATLTVTAAAKSKVYGAADPALTYTASGFVNGDTSAIMTGTLTRAAGENVGDYAINQGSVAATSNYTISYTSANLTVTASTLTVTAAAKSKVYGAADPALTYTASGFVNGDTSAIMTGTLTRAAGENVGDYAINQGSVAATSNYTISYSGANLTVTKADQTITFGALTAKSYGDSDYAPGGSASSELAVSYASSDPAVATIVGGNIHIVGVGTTTITASQAGDSNYNAAADVPQSLTVNAKTLTITAEAKSKTYGAVDPALTYTASGLVGGDTISGSLTRAAGDNVGNYAINQGTLSAGSNYTISFTSANLTVTAATLTVTAEAKSKTYGAADPALTYTASGFVNGDTVAIMSGSLTRAAGENVGIFAINQGSVAATGNYTISYTGANLTVTAATLTVTAEAKSKTYGAADPALTYTASGFVNGDTVAIMSGSLTRAAGENVGIFAINQGSVAATGNYTISYTGANLTVTAATLTVTAEAKSKTYGAADPALTYTASGFVNGDTVAIMSGSLTRAAGENVGNYAINQGSVAATGNYTISYTGANLTVTAATLTVTAEAKSKTYGAADPALTYTASGFVNGDTVAIMSGSLTRAAGENVGIFAINQGSVAATSNYTISYTGANLTITVAGQSITLTTPAPATAVYLTQFTVAATASSSLAVTYSSGSPSICTNSGDTFTMISGTGTCIVQYDQAGDANYSAAPPVTNSVTADKASQTIDPITFNPTTLAVSGTTTAIAATTSGLTVTFSSDTPLVCTVSGTTVTGVSAGDCTVRASQAGNGNYSAATDVTQLLAVTGGSTTVTLTVTTAGDGTATVVSAPGSIVCARDNNLESGVCSDNTFTNPTDVTLTAAPDERTEVSWTGGCTATGNECGPFILNSNSGVTATFNFKQRVKLGISSYATIQDAYNAAIMGATTLQVRDETFTGDLLFDSTLDVTFIGGHNVDWIVLGNTTVIGTVTIAGASGSVTISNLIIE